MDPFVPPLLPVPLDWEALVTDISATSAALARYDGLLQGLADPEILLSPLRTREAVLSSRIEGTRATLEEVLEHEADPVEPPGPKLADIQEIINYRAAVQLAVEELDRRPFSLNLIRRTHAVLMDSVRGHGRARGEFRRIQNYIAAPGEPIDRARYVPPPPNEMMPLLDNLEKYVHSSEKDTIVQVGLVHAQFEIIHPFLDGNGRVGRILIPLLLFAKGIISSPAFYLSGHLEANREEYYRCLNEVTANSDYQAWCSFFLTAVGRQAVTDAERIREMLRLREDTTRVALEATRSQFVVQVIDTLFRLPIFTSSRFSSESGVSAPTTARLLRELRDAGVVRVSRPGRGRRPAVWSFPALLAIVR